MGDMDQLEKEMEALKKKNSGPVSKKSNMKAGPSMKAVRRM